MAVYKETKNIYVSILVIQKNIVNQNQMQRDAANLSNFGTTTVNLSDKISVAIKYYV